MFRLEIRLLFMLFLSDTTLASLSGLYIDNGIDQTVMQHVLSRQEKKEVEHEILNLLGLPERPKLRKVMDYKSSAPKFLLDVYKTLDNNAASRSHFTGKDLRAIGQSDVIMTFTSHNKHVSSVRHERGKRLWFDVSEVPSDESIVGAELRLYQSSNMTSPSNQSYTLTIFMVLDYHDEKELEFVDSVNTTGGNEGWLVFNMTRPLASWVSLPWSNKGLYLSLHFTSNSVHELLPDDIGVITRPKRGEVDKQPFMVAFLRADNTVKRSPRVRRQSTRRRKKTTDNSYLKNPLIDQSSWSHPQKSCRIQTLYVSFKDLDWQDWIIAPDGYGAFYCSGECNFPLNAHMNATNHAVVQTLVHLMKPLEVPKPYCAPTKLSAISVLYFLDDSNVMLKKYKNMVVKSCGCH